MTGLHKAMWAVAAVVLLVVSVSWLRAHDAALTVATQLKADGEASAAILEREKESKAELTEALGQLAAQKAAVQTPAQVVKALPTVINLPAPVVQVTAAQAAASVEAGKGLPDAPVLHAGDLLVPEADAKPWYDAMNGCKADGAKLLACSGQVTDDAALMAVKDREIGELQVALKGGTKWQRTKSAFKWVGVGALVGAGAVVVVRR